MLNFDRARILRPLESDGLLLPLTFIIIVDAAIFGAVLVTAGRDSWRASTVRRRDKLQLTRGPPLMSRLRKLSVLDQQKVVFADLIAARLVGCVYGFSRNGIEEFLFEAMARAPVNLPKGDPLRRRDCGIERDRTRHEGQFQIALPVWSGCRHRKLQRNRVQGPSLSYGRSQRT